MTAAKDCNRLGQEKSPYLLQHADNPVEWHPWGEEAFAIARRENKPIFLSVGYSTCHWCHVMAHESFESETIAAIMNREFVNIKVDREERPDVDRVYMTFVQATTGHGGWPMSVWLTPDLKPFAGGTYFPPEDRHGQPGFPSVLRRIAQAWKQNAEKITEQGAKIISALQEAAASSRAGEGNLGEEALEQCYQQFSRSYDAHEGGFGSAPKFPRPVALNFLFRFSVRESVAASSRRHALDMALFTLRKMAAGGMHDHLGGGFHRYSVDASWHVPHFEKMLYDQAQLACAYIDAFQLTREPLLERVARDILDYVRRDMTAPEGGFYSAEDADSVVGGGQERGKDEDAPAKAGHPPAQAMARHGRPPPQQKAEGAFYVWAEEEIAEALGRDDAAIFNFHYGVRRQGNAPPGTDPHGEFTGKNILIERHELGQTAKKFGLSEAQADDVLERSRQKLLNERAKRPRPHLDDKIITAWNGLMISAFARAAQVFGDDTYLEAGSQAATFIRRHLYDAEKRTLRRNFRGGPGRIPGFAEDYAFLIEALLDLYEADLGEEWLAWALELQETLDRLFWDEKNGGYFSSTGEDRTVLLRMKEDHDSAEPAPSSVAALNLLRLAQICDDDRMRQRGVQTIGAFGGILSQLPSAMPQMLVALDFSQAKPRQIVLAGERGSAQLKALMREVHRPFLPNKVLLHAEDGASAAVGEMTAVSGKATAYVCENFVCRAPVTEPDELGKMLNVAAQV